MYNFLKTSLYRMFSSGDYQKGTKTFNNEMLRLLNRLKTQGIIKSTQVYDSMKEVDRGDFSDSKHCYEDWYINCLSSPQSINYNATISAPHMHAYALEYLKDFLKPGGRVLDIGAGSGYLTVALSKMMNDEGMVVGIEHIPQLANLATENIKKNHKNLLDEGKIVILASDGRIGCDKYAPYDVIHVGAAAPQVPKELINQLANNGRMMIPVGQQQETQYIYLIDKDNEGNISYAATLSVLYVPLTSKENQLNKN